jgi:WD40 repeat protein
VTLAIGDRDGVARLWDVRRGEQTASWQVVPKHAHIRRLAFSPDGRLLAVAADDFLRLWKVAEVFGRSVTAPEGAAP